jgi:beta-lactamase class A
MSHRPLPLVLISMLLMGAAVLTAAPSPIQAARAEIARLIAESGAEVAVAWRPLEARRGEEILINAKMRFHAASTMKLPVMIELFRQIDKKRLKLDDTLVVSNQFKSIVDGSAYTLSEGSDSDDEMYRAIGRPMTLRDLCEHMITTSSNLAANILIEKLGPKNIQSTANHLGGSGMHVLRGVEDQKAFDKGLNNSTDATALLNLLTKIARGNAVSRTASAGMIEILKRQTFNDGIPSGLPAGTAVAHKTGTITGIHHDAAIVLGPRPYVLVVLVRGIRDQKISAKLMGDIARVIDRLTHQAPPTLPASQ